MLRVDLSEIVAACVTGLLTGAAVWYRDRRKERMRHAVPAAATAQLKQRKVLTALARDLGCVRATLIKIHDSGQVPHGGRDLKATILAESDPVPGVAPIALDWKGRHLDPEYLRLVYELEGAGVLMIRTADLGSGTLLRDEMDRIDAVSAWAVTVRAEPERWFLALCESRHLMAPTATARATLRAASARLARCVVPNLDVTLEDTQPISLH